MANIYELPVGVVPVTRVLKAEEKDENESLLPVIHEAL